MLVGLQETTFNGGIIDISDNSRRCVGLIELKRDRITRKLVAQAI